MSLPIDKPRPAVQSFRGAAHGFTIEPALLERLRALARARSTTLYTVCLAAFDVLLHRYTGETDILVGSPMAGRTAAHAEGAIGYFANTIVLRARCGDNPRFTDFLADVSRTVLDALDGQDYPFPLLVESLKIGRDPSRAPLCDVLFSWDKPHYRQGPAAPAGLVAEPRQIRQLGSTHDLATICFERGDRCDCIIQYSTDLFEAATIARMAEHYTNLLNAVVAAPDERIGQLAILSEAERHALVVSWNDTTTAYPRVPVPILFDQQARRTPEAIALEFADVTLSYREVDRRSSRLANFLRLRGVGRGAVVAVCMERSADFVVALLGVIKAGAAYLPLDPSYPADRLRFMFDDSNAIVLLTHRATASRLPDRQPILVDDEAFEAGRLSDDLVAADTTADDVVYVMYTSGSTGQPKGISIPHRAVVRLVRDTNYITIAASDRIGHASNTSFDALTFEVWGALLNGATLVEVPRETVLSSRALAAHVRNAGISVMFLTTALVNQMALEMPDGFASLRCLLLGGEACDPNLVRAIVEGGPPGQLVNVYGPTESTTFATSFRIDDVAPGAATVPIGMPIANTCLYLLDSHMQLVPIGVIGEVYFGGDGLALEYRGRPELTADRFVPNPFQPAARLYRTGDLARRLPDGNVVFVGRRDQQVKIRGFRIELGEIETALRSHADVGDALVVSPGAGIDKRLVAFVASQRVPAPTSLELRSYLQQRLPDYMIPGQIVVRNGLPLTANGKVNRRALDDAAAANVGLDDDFVPAGTETEQRLARLWAAALGTDDVGIHSDFFALGGHSLLATRLVSTIRQEFDVTLPLTALFDTPTVAAIGATVDRLRGERQERLRAEILASLDGMSDDQVEAALARLNGQSSTE